jgi:hypothetical protein
VAAALRDGDEQVRARACVALAHLGGREAADALAGRLEAPSESDRRRAVAALAWLRDERALKPAGDLFARSGQVVDLHSPAWALARLLREDELPMLRELAVGLLAKDTPETSVGYPQARELLRVLTDEHPAQAQALLAEIAAAPGAHGARLLEEHRTLPPDEQPAGPGVVPRRHFAGLRRSPPSGGYGAKWGGQPDWLEEPAWPVGGDGLPMLFYGQLPLDDQPGRMAYVFVALDEDAETWEPLGTGNALVVQPGPPPSVRTEPRATGPARYALAEDLPAFHPPAIMRPYERWIDLAGGADPERWELPDAAPGARIGLRVEDRDKLGGTPLFLQGEQWPPGDGWRFAFQFNAARAGHELADGAECYGFVREDGAGASYGSVTSGPRGRGRAARGRACGCRAWRRRSTPPRSRSPRAAASPG